MKKRTVAIIMAVAMISSVFTGCGKKDSTEKAKTDSTSKGVKEFTAFFGVEGAEINADNEIQKIITEKIGAKCKETWLTGQTQEEAIGMLIANGEYPDFVDGGDSTAQLIDAGAFVPIDEYFDKYPNVKNFWSEAQWNSLRQKDGHIYTMPQFDKINEKPMDTRQNGEAFWIQTRVLKWADYPKIESLDELFKLLGDYYKANPKMKDGSSVIPFEILTYDWYYFCLENPPLFLDGHPNNGSVIVDKNTHKVSDYNITDTAKRYFKKLNDEYKKGIIDKEFMTINHDQFMEKISSGRVLCMVEQHWDFLTAEDSIRSQGLDDCTYVPLGITIDKGMKEMYYTANEPATFTSGLGVTKSCKDVEGAFKFLNDILSPEITTLRSWGVKDKDYLVDDKGLFYRTKEMRDNAVSSEYKASHLCTYSYFPNYKGMNLDGINASEPIRQPSEFFDSLTPEVQECLKKYNAKTYVEMLDQNTIDPMEEPWYPMWSYSNTMTTNTPGGLARTKMDETKHKYLPQLVIADDFESSWNEYMKAYKKCKPEKFLSEMQEEVYNRIKLVTGKDVKEAK